MGKTTPGPWVLHGPGSVRACDGRHESTGGCRTIAEAEIIGVSRAEAEANAHLIAAAPELREALKMVVALRDYDVSKTRECVTLLCDGEIMGAILAALAKAEGR